jgi:hypothetical protein
MPVLFFMVLAKTSGFFEADHAHHLELPLADPTLLSRKS